jgi:hypothetical protein
MEWFSVLKSVQLMLAIVSALLLAAKILVIVAGHKKSGDDYKNKILGWYSNMEIYGSGNPFRVKVLNTANKLTTFFWITLVVVIVLYFLSDRFLS